MKTFNIVLSLLKNSSTRRIPIGKLTSVYSGTESFEKPAFCVNVVRRKFHSSGYRHSSGMGSKDMLENDELKEKILGKKEFLIEDLKEEDLSEVKEFMRNHYFSRNPLNAMLNLTYEDQKDMTDASISKRIGNKVSIVARDRKTKKIVGSCIPRILTKAEELSVGQDSINNYNKNIKVERLLHILEILKSSVNFFEKYGVNKILELSMTTIDPAYQGRGLLNTLHLECGVRGKDVGCQLVMGQITNSILQKQAIKFGFTKEFELEFDSIMIDGEKVLDLEKNLGTNSFMVFSMLL